MDRVVSTPRLKLTLVTKALPGSEEFKWLHKLRTDEKCVAWSIYGVSKTTSDTEKIAARILPQENQEDSKPRSYSIVYAVHELLPPSGDPLTTDNDQRTEFIGHVMLKQVGDGNLALPESLTIPASSAASTLSLELGYMFLPGAWGKGYAAEALTAVFHACKKVERKYWGAWEKVYVRAIVNDGNPASLRVMEKAGVKEKGVFEWKGKPVFLNGTWESESRLHIFGFYLVE